MPRVLVCLGLGVAFFVVPVLAVKYLLPEPIAYFMIMWGMHTTLAMGFSFIAYGFASCVQVKGSAVKFILIPPPVYTGPIVSLLVMGVYEHAQAAWPIGFFDWWDVVAGIAGTVLAAILYHFVCKWTIE